MAGSVAAPSGGTLPIGELLVRQRALRRRSLALGLAKQAEERSPLGEVLVAHGYSREDRVYRVLAHQWQVRFVNLDHHWVDETLANRMPAALALRYRLIPIRQTRTAAIVAMADPRDQVALESLSNRLQMEIIPVLASPDAIRRKQRAVYHVPLVAESTTGLRLRNPDASADHLLTRPQKVFLILLAYVCVLGLVALGTVFFIVLMGIIIGLYAFVVTFRTFITYRGAKYGTTQRVSDEELAALTDLPIYTILCPLFNEAGVLPQLVQAISSLDYPRSKLDVKLLLEADDVETLATVAIYRLPAYFDVVVVPAEGQRTKPKACNYGLQLARGEYTVIYDAEDIPEPLQLKKALAIFRRSPASVGCVQAKLNYYNSHQNVLTGWFSLEYISWFDLFLPGLENLGLPIPLGGSSNHLPTRIIREVGGWDPNNVTEDADLGMRLLRYGYTTTVVDSITGEEANSDFVNWVKQRSRWGKGYWISWIVQMRHPVRLLRDVGLRGFVAATLTLGGTYSAALLNLLMWTLTILWILAQFGFIAYLFPPWIYYVAMVELLIGNFFFLYLNLWCAEFKKDYRLTRLALISPAYWLMMSLAMIKATLQLFNKPAFWEKTEHGLYAEPARAPVRGFAALTVVERRIHNRDR